jgi:hypothetical protein
MLYTNVIRKRPVRKPRKIWNNAVDIESREIPKVRSWKTESPDRSLEASFKGNQGSILGCHAIDIEDYAIFSLIYTLSKLWSINTESVGM